MQEYLRIPDEKQDNQGYGLFGQGFQSLNERVTKPGRVQKWDKQRSFANPARRHENEANEKIVLDNF